MATKPIKYDLTKSTVRECVLARIEKLGLTPWEVANSGKVDASPSTVYRYFTGESNSTSEVVASILEAVGLTLADKPGFNWA